MKIAFGNDHAAASIRGGMIDWLRAQGHEVVDFGTDSADSVDYPDFAAKVARAVANDEAETGILVCGTGIGMSIAANKVPGVRAAVVTDEYGAEMARRHNDANVLCLRSRELPPDMNRLVMAKFLATEFEGGRHEQRITKIAKLEGGG